MSCSRLMFFMGRMVPVKPPFSKPFIWSATGRSFRTHIPKNYIQHDTADAVVFARSASEKIGMQKLQSGEQLIKVNGDSIATQGQLARILPLQLIDPQSTDIIDHGAKPRKTAARRLMFHVERVLSCMAVLLTCIETAQQSAEVTAQYFPVRT